MPRSFSDWFSKKRSADLPAWWQEYLARQGQGLARRTPLPDIPFAVIDTETTGLEKDNRRILAIGGVKVRGGRIRVAETMECRVKQAYQPENSAVEVHGILPGGGEVSDLADALRKTVAFLGGAVVVGHHLAFDLEVLNDALRTLGAGPLKNPVLDTVALARRMDPANRPVPPGHYSLDALCRRYGIRPADRHTAAGDAYLTAQLLLKLLRRLEERGVTDWGGLIRRRSW